WVRLPEDAAQIERQYRPGTNVLETTYSTANGRVRVTDVMTLPDGGLTPFRELARRVDGLAGCATLRRRIEPRCAYGTPTTPSEPRKPFPIATSGNSAVAACVWGAGNVETDDGALGGRFEAGAGTRSTPAAAAAVSDA